MIERRKFFTTLATAVAAQTVTAPAATPAYANKISEKKPLNKTPKKQIVKRNNKN